MNTSQNSDRTIYREAPVAQEPKRNNAWLPLLLLLPLLFVGGFLLGNSLENNQEETTVSASTTPRFGVGGGPGEPVVTPLPEDEDKVMEEDIRSPSPTEDFGDEMEDKEEITASPTSSPRTSSPSATFQRTGEESSI